jgi:hypothetical protein
VYEQAGSFALLINQQLYKRLSQNANKPVAAFTNMQTGLFAGDLHIPACLSSGKLNMTIVGIFETTFYSPAAVCMLP